MKGIIRKTSIALGLYNLRTLLAKFFELFLINPKRFYNYKIDIVPNQMIQSETIGQTANDLRHVEHKTVKTIYFLVHCFYPFSQGGTERFIYNMASQAKNNGHVVKIISYNATQPRKYFNNEVSNVLFNEYQIDGLNVLEYRHKRAPRGTLKDFVTHDPDVFAFAQYLFNKEKPDIVHVGYIQKVSSFIEACKRNAIPYGITLTSYFCLCHYDIMIDAHGQLCSGSEKGKKCQRLCKCLDVSNPSLRYEKMHEMMKDAVFLAAPSLFVKQVVEQEFPNLNIQVINHGISREFISEDRMPIHQNEIKNFAYFGNLIPIKGVHVLIAAFKALPPEYKLNIFGSGSESYIYKLKKLAQGNENISFRGSVKYDEMYKAYANNEVIVVPSIWYETYNFVIHEALLMNRIVVASHIGAIPERIKNGINGFTFQAGNWRDLKRTLEKVIQKKINVIGADEPINTVAQEFKQYNLLYEEAIGKENDFEKQPKT